MGSDLEFNPIEARHGFGDSSRDAEPGHAYGPRELPWQGLVEALEDGDIPLARNLYRKLLRKHPEWDHPPLTEVGTLLASANHQGALEVLKTMRSLASAIQPRKPASAPQPIIGFRGQGDLTTILGLKIDKSA